mmetsp:Transcript_14839/g.35055  ORF Transcript_14839/g.35055 Transcript_14839/m.35055 type:complete len:202 (-) Transcript_14839:134-739(-)
MVDHPWLDPIHHLQYDHAVTHVIEEVSHVPLDAERVDPHAEGALLSRVAAVVVGQLGEQRQVLLIRRLEAGARVEEGGAEAEVELLVGLDDVGGADAELGGEPRTLLDDVRGALELVRAAAQDVGVALALRVDLLEQDTVGLAVAQVVAEVGDAPVGAGLLEVEVDPAQKDLLGRELEQVLERLAVLDAEGGELGNFAGGG